MDIWESTAWADAFEEFFADFADCFQRERTRACAADYIRGLLAEVERKNCWQIAEWMGQADPQQTQRLMYEAKWDADEVCQRLRGKVVVRLGYQPGVGVIDESGFVKRGEKSAGVGRQYGGRLGKVEHCQVGVFLGYVAPLGYAFVDRELYLPKEWCEAAERRAEAHIPEAVSLPTKPQLAQQRLARAWGEGIPMQWVAADSPYGNSPGLRNFIHDQQRYYVMEVPQTLPVRLVAEAPPQAVNELVGTLEAWQWQRLAFGFGEKGLNFYDWAALRVTPTPDEVGEQWLLLRRTLENGEVTDYGSNAPVSTPLETLAEVASARWGIERLLEEGKGEAGLADYEVRHWQAWYRPIPLSFVAHPWLTLVRHEERKKTVLTAVADGQFGPTTQGVEYAFAASGVKYCFSGQMVAVAAQETAASHCVPLPGHAPLHRFASVQFPA